MLSNFNLPSVDHLVEGVHYRIVNWNFAEGCPEGEKMVFGTCRKVGQNPNDDKDFDSSKKTKDEEKNEAEAKKQGSDVKNNKPVMVDGKKMGWAVKNGKPVMVEWGSVAGEKKVGPKQPAAKPKQEKKPEAPAASSSPANVIANPSTSPSDRQAAINEVGRKVLEN
jgi:hypothetical protein